MEKFQYKIEPLGFAKFQRQGQLIEMSTPGVVNGHTRTSPYEYTPSAPANIAFLSTFV
jgi:hypothetical protein